MYKKIFCPIDGSEISTRGMNEAIRLAKDQNAQLCFLHVIDNGALIMYAPATDSAFETIRACGQEILDGALTAARILDVAATQKLIEIVTGRVAATIVEEAQKYHADLIVMGTHGRRGISRLLMGSDATSVVATGSTSVLLVK